MEEGVEGVRGEEGMMEDGVKKRVGGVDEWMEGLMEKMKRIEWGGGKEVVLRWMK